MREKIIEELRKIEGEYKVKICYAVESGSRAWGFPSKDSDYDVRFIYVHKPEWYLSIEEKRDVIEHPINDVLDISGWEIRKALRLFKKSNPSLLEWLQSEIVYYQAYSLVEKLRAIQNDIFLPQSGMYHYLNMAKGNYRDFLQKDQVKTKKYLNILRPILACNWIEKYNKVSPANFEVLVEDILEDGQLKQEILTLVDMKINGDELNLEPKMTAINEFMKRELVRLENYAKTLRGAKQDITPRLDTLLRDTLTEVWTK